jgi:hypothetical protein
MPGWRRPSKGEEKLSANLRSVSEAAKATELVTNVPERACHGAHRRDHGAEEVETEDPDAAPWAVLVAAHRPPAFRAARTMWARANSCAICAATSGKRFGSTTVGAAGQTMRTMAGIVAGSASSIFS